VAYLRGLEHERFFADALPLAADLVHRATTLDPQFAAAWARLSIADSALYHRGIDRSPQRLDRARHAAGAALELEPELAEAHRAVGYVAYWGDRDYDRALEAFGRAAELGGADADTLADTAYVLRRQGRFDEALERLRVAARLDPLSATRRLVVADTLMFMHRNAEAERHFERAIALEPDLPLAYGLRAINHLLWDGSVERARSTLDEMPAVRAPWATLYTAWVELAARRVESVEQTLAASPALLLEADHVVVPVAELTARAFELAGDAPTSREAWQRAQALLERELAARPNDPRIQGALGVALAALGRADTALSHGRRATEIEPLTRDAFVAGTMRLQQLAEIHARLGQSSEAVAILTDLVARPSWISPAWLAVDPAWDSLRAEPGFQALVRPAARP
jgi:tetratricopeptide (TPR) repeat protein